jgi:two-component system cell cycle response regulator DivK
MKVLIVEDNRDNARLAELALRKRGIESVVVPAVAEAREALQRGTFGCILMDINLGTGPTGLDLLREIRAGHADSSIPIIAVTAFASDGDRHDLLREGFDRYLAKPYDPGALVQLVESVLRPAA